MDTCSVIKMPPTHPKLCSEVKFDRGNFEDDVGKLPVSMGVWHGVC
jgi:hypothetical protein